MKRRNFILNVSILSTRFLLPLGNAFARIANARKALPSWTELVNYARWCPSPHNVQPWKMRVISPEEAHLYYDPKRIPIVVDGTSAFTTAGMGMFIECLSIAAGKHGYKVEAEHEHEEILESKSTELRLFAKLHLTTNAEDGYIDRELILKRKTSRMHYDGRIIPNDLVDRIKNIASDFGHDFIFSTDTGLIKYTIDLNSKSVLERAKEEAARKEMCQWIRTTDREAADKKDGWWYRCTGIPGAMLYKFFYHHERFESRWKTKKANVMLNRSMTGTGNLAWISGPFATRNDWVNAGTMLQRMWLEITKHNVYMHPFGPVITTLKSHEMFARRINYSGDISELWFLVRLGYSSEPPRSFRLEAKDIFI